MEYCISYDTAIIYLSIIGFIFGFIIRGWITSYNDRPARQPLKTPPNPYSRLRYPIHPTTETGETPGCDDCTRPFPPRKDENL